MTLLLLAIAAPAGLAVAGEQSRPYIVVFKDDAVTQQVADSHVYLVRRPAPAKSTSSGSKSGGERSVDSGRVRKHVSELQARMRIRVGNVYDSALGGFSTDLTPTQVTALLNDPAVAEVVPDEDVRLDEDTETGIEATDMEAGGIRTTANPRSNVPAGVRRVGASRNVLARAGAGHNTRVNADVAIIDTGVQRDHPDLNVVGGYNCTSSNRNRWDDVDGHGTHVAGIIGALDNRFGVVGVAPGARLWSVKVLGPHGSGRMSWLLCGVDWVTSQRDRSNPSRPFFEVANMSISFGLPGSKDQNCGKSSDDQFHQAICRSVARGTVYVVAAGNEHHNAKLNRPAAYDEVITVSAMADYDGRGGGLGSSGDSCPYWSGEKDDAFTSFSNYGPDVDLIAPGRCVLSTYKRSKYGWMSGTSMAAPHVTGAVAVYRAMYPRATPQQVRLALEAVGTRDWRTNSDPDNNPEKAVWIGAFRTMPDFSTSAGAASSLVTVGNSLNVTVAVSRVGGFTEPVSVDLQDPAAGITASPSSTSGSTASLNVSVAPNVRPGSYMLVVRSTSGDLQRTSVVPIVVQDDLTAPAAPSLGNLASDGTLAATYFTGRTTWVRGSARSVDVNVDSSDAESGVAAFNASVRSDGWAVSWVGDPADGVLRLSHSRDATDTLIAVTSTNGAGLTSASTVALLRLDTEAPVAVTWAGSASAAARTPGQTTYTLDWTGGSDAGAGLAATHWVQRYRAPMNSNGTCRVAAFKQDGAGGLRSDGSLETGLAPGSCYRWSVRTLDRVGNAAPAVWSDTWATDPR